MQQLSCKLFLLVSLFTIVRLNSFGQACFRIESILIDACATDEGQNEMVRFKVGSTALNTAQMNVSWATTSNPWGGVCQNATTTNLINQINASIVNCGFVKAPIGGILPANSNVILITGTQFIPANNSFANLSDTVYVIFQCGSSLVGNFANFGAGIRTFSMSFLAPAACTQTVQYDRALLVGGDGALVNYTSTGIASYDNNGCSAPVVIYDPSWTPPAPLCSSAGSINLNNLVTGDLGGIWSGPGVTGNNFDPSGLSGDIDITYQFGASTCISAVSETNTIQLVASGNSAWTAPLTICSGDPSLNLNTLITGTAGGTWSGTGVTGNTFNPSGLAGGISITYTVGSGSCVSTTTSEIQVSNASNASWTIPPAMCSGDAAINLNSQITGTQGGIWSGNGVTGSSFNPNGLSGSISVSYSVGSGSCASTSTQNITVNQGGNSNWTSPSFVCANDPSINLNGLLTGTTGGTWSGTGVTGNNFNPSGLNGSISVTYSVGSGNCISSSTNEILVTGTGNPSWTTTSLCDSENAINLNTLVTGNSGGSWSGSGVTGNTFSPSGLNGLISITYTVGTGSCLQASTQVIEVIMSPNAPTLTGNNTYCQNEIIGPITATGAAGALFSWAISDTPEVEIFAGSVYLPTATVSTNYQVTQTINACRSAPASFNLVINDRPATPVLPSEITVCTGIPAQVLSVESNATVFWFSSSAGTTAIAQGLTLNPADFGYADYSAIAVMNGCSSGVALTNVIFGEGISADILGNDVRNVCFPKLVTLQSADATKNLWSTGETSTSITVSRPGIYILERFSDCAIARDTVELIDVGVSADFLVNYPQIGFFPINAQLESISENSTNCAFYLNGITIEPDGNGIITLEQDTSYSIQQICSNNFGCKDTVSRSIEIKSPSELYVPNAFTPNGDFNNEVFAVKGFQIENLQLIIFNRWGEEVYVIKDLNDSWDGNTKAGTLAPEGVYTYKLRAIDFRQKLIEFSGSLMLMR
jgi:gliding motility-associated-like protein